MKGLLADVVECAEDVENGAIPGVREYDEAVEKATAWLRSLAKGEVKS